MKLNRITQLTTAALMLSSSMVWAETGLANAIEVFEQERVDIQQATRAYFPSEAVADKASISFHNKLLESQKDEGYLVMQLSAQDKAKLKPFGFTFAPATQWIAQRNKEITRLQQQATKTANQQSKAASDSIPNYPCYSTVENTYQKAESLAGTYPKLAQWQDIGDSWTKTVSDPGQLFNGYDINVLKMTNSETDGDKPILFIHSAMHAREYATAELTLRFAHYLLENYGSNADVTWVLDNHQVHIVFHMNPDGRKNAEFGAMWRKNVNNNYCSTGGSTGADLNRNFSLFWNTTETGSSGQECSNVFRGPEPASEPETQAIEQYIRSIFADRRGPNDTDAAPLDTTGIHLDVHSFSELVLWPWGHDEEPAPNGDQLTTLGRKFAYFNGYRPQQAIGLYPTDGTSDDVSYGELGVAAYTFELGTAFFQACATFESTVLPDNLKALMYAAKVVRAPYKLPSGPDAADLTLNGKEKLTIPSGEAVTLGANINDTRYQNSNGTEWTQNIVAAEYYVNQAPWAEGAKAIALQTSDGTLDSSVEAMQAQIDTSNLSNGKHMIYVRGKDADGNWGAVSAIYLTIGVPAPNVAPVSSFTQQCTGVNCTFDATGSSDSDGEIVRYRWYMGDGTEITQVQLESLDYQYAADGTYIVELSVTDDAGSTTISEATFDVANSVPTADFSVNCTNNSCTFDASGSSDSDGSIIRYTWFISDGVTVEGGIDIKTIDHDFTTAGTFEVELKVTDDTGASDLKTVSVTVTMPAEPDPVEPPPSPVVTPTSSGGGSLGFVGLLLLAGGLVRRR